MKASIFQSVPHFSHVHWHFKITNTPYDIAVWFIQVINNNVNVDGLPLNILLMYTRLDKQPSGHCNERDKSLINE